MTPNQKRDRLLSIARDRLALHPNAYLKFLFLHSASFGESFPAFFWDDLNQAAIAAIDPTSALREFDRSAVAFVDRWASENIDPPSPRVAPILPMHAAWHDAAVPPMGVTTATRALHAPAPASATIKSESIKTPGWSLKRPTRFQGYRKPLYDLLKAAHASGKPLPTARDVLDEWKETRPTDVYEITDSGLKYYDPHGDPKPADLDAIRKAIARLVQ
ncbi:MAG: hypothetical protein KA781_06050 [Aquabacterium sp.]|nr:hypothetical protein [Aquabacterium sp.]